MINFTLGVDLGSPSMKYPKNGFKIKNNTQIPKMNPDRGFCFIVQWGNRIELIVRNALNFRGEMDYGSSSTGKKTK